MVGGSLSVIKIPDHFDFRKYRCTTITTTIHNTTYTYQTLTKPSNIFFFIFKIYSFNCLFAFKTHTHTHTH